ncbi:MAG: hypothetical protein IE881_08860, partial [Epsilonproteobacteria bacterium]|nr:hypothetical protein [Campylobacterota bacterium]
MNATVGKVQSIEGKFFAKIGSETIELKVGDSIVEGMIVFGDKNNLPSAHIEIVTDENEMIVLNGQQIQLFDASLVATFENEDGIQPDNVMALLDKELYSDQSEQAEKEDDAILIEKTEAGEQTPQTKDGQEASFDARDGKLVDVTTTLRDTTFPTPPTVQGNKDAIPEINSGSTPTPLDVDSTLDEIIDADLTASIGDINGEVEATATVADLVDPAPATDPITLDV